MPVFFKQIRLSLVCTAAFYLFFFSGILVFWTPLPLVYLSLRRQKEAWVASLILVLLLALFLYGWGLPRLRFLGLGFSLYYWLAGLALSLGVWKRWSLARWGFWSGLWVTGGVFLFAVSGQLAGFFDLHAIWGEVLNEAAGWLGQAENLNLPAGERLQILALMERAKSLLPLFPMFLPALFFTLTLFILGLNIAGLNLFRHFLKQVPWPWSFRKLQIPDPCLWSLLLAGFLFFLNAYFLHQAWVKIFVVNLLICIAFIYFFQGLSIVSFFISRYSLLLQVGVYGLLAALFSNLGLIVMALGLIDIWADFRKLRAKVKKE